MYTLCTVCDTILDTGDAIAELLLCCAQVLVGIGQVLDLIVELFFHLRKLLA
jgi:hypothetical protein